MLLIIRRGASREKIDELSTFLRGLGLQTSLAEGKSSLVMNLNGDTSALDDDLIASFDAVEAVKRIHDPVLKATRKYHHEDTVVDCSGVNLGGGMFTFIAGPCSVENETQMIAVAQAVKEAGATMLRGGAFKPRTSPYAFQGLHDEGIRLLLKAKKETGLPIVTEIMDSSDLPLFDEVDVIQVGARNMQNFELLKKLGKIQKPVLLKRGLASTVNELMMSAEYIMAGGNEQIILCERGIRTFETATRNTLDLSAVPVLHAMSHLPVVVDPSHATGMSKLVTPMALAAAACGADGLMIEVHNDPKHALCDGVQSLKPEDFAALVRKVKAVRSAVEGV